MTVTIGALTEREFFAWYALLSEYASGQGVSLTDEGVMRVWTAVQAPGALATGAHDEQGELVGFAHAIPFERLLSGEGGYQVEDVYVAERVRRTGVATAMLEHVRSSAESAGRPLLRWQAGGDDAAAQALQEKVAGSGRVLQTSQGA